METEIFEKEYIASTLVNMFVLQHKNNLNTVPEYYDKDLGWPEAVVAEAGELLESCNYKWWKKQTIDKDNVLMELVDIWHFVMSGILVKSGVAAKAGSDTGDKFKDLLQQEVISDIDNLVEFEKPETEDLVKARIAIVDFISRFSLYYYERIAPLVEEDKANLFKELAYFFCIDFIEIVYRFGFTYEDLLRTYLIKNALNTLRQNYGYKEGTYVKEWPFLIESLEDNVVAKRIVSDESDFDSVYSLLQKYYTANVIHSEDCGCNF